MCRHLDDKWRIQEQRRKKKELAKSSVCGQYARQRDGLPSQSLDQVFEKLGVEADAWSKVGQDECQNTAGWRVDHDTVASSSWSISYDGDESKHVALIMNMMYRVLAGLAKSRDLSEVKRREREEVVRRRSMSIKYNAHLEFSKSHGKMPIRKDRRHGLI